MTTMAMDKNRKDIEHGLKKETTGKEIDTMLDEADKYLKRVNRLFTQIEKIKEDGTIVFTEAARQLYKEWLGTDIEEELRLENAEEMALELKSLTNKVADKYNVKLEL